MTNQASAVGALSKRSITTRTKATASDYFLTINGESYSTQAIATSSRQYLEFVRSFNGLIDTNFRGILSAKNYANTSHVTVDDLFSVTSASMKEKRFVGGIDLDRFNHSSDTLNSGTSTIGQTMNLLKHVIYMPQ